MTEDWKSRLDRINKANQPRSNNTARDQINDIIDNHVIKALNEIDKKLSEYSNITTRITNNKTAAAQNANIRVYKKMALLFIFIASIEKQEDDYLISFYHSEKDNNERTIEEMDPINIDINHPEMIEDTIHTTFVSIYEIYIPRLEITTFQNRTE